MNVKSWDEHKQEMQAADRREWLMTFLTIGLVIGGVFLFWWLSN